MKVEDYFLKKLLMISSAKLIVSEFDKPMTSRELDIQYKKNSTVQFSLVDINTIDTSIIIDQIYSKTLCIITNNPLLHKIIDFCRTNNIEAYLVGGPLRDIITGRKTNDLDIMINGSAIELFKNYSNFDKYISIKKNSRFNTLKISDDKQSIDIASSRKETYNRHGILPEVKLTNDIVADLGRRDFSINAIALSLTGNPGVLIDPFSGINDLEKHLINVLHPESFLDDPTRILRALKFLIRMKLKLTDSTKNYIKSAFQADALNKISGFRFLREIVFMLKEQDSLIDILLLLKEHSIIESFTGRNIDNYNEKIIEIFESSGLYDVDSEKLFKAIFIFFYSNQIGKEFMRIHFEKFGFKQKVLKKTQQGQSFEKILLLIVK